MNGLAITKDSAVVLSGNVFQSVTVSSSAIRVVSAALRVSWHSVFAVVGNTFHMDGSDSTLIHLEGPSQSLSLSVRNNSAVVIRGNLVSRPVSYFILFFGALRVESESAVVFQGNDMQGSSAVFYSGFSSCIYYNSWLQLSGNLCRESPLKAFAVLIPMVNLRDSTVSVSGNRFMSSTGTPTVLRISAVSSVLTNGAIVAACNTVNGEEGVKYSISSVYNATILTCSDPCALAASCFPAYTSTAPSDGCTCTCAEGGHGDACLPVAVPEPPSTDGADLCVRDVRVDVEVSAGSGTLVVCYVGVTFAADVVVEMELMSGSVRNVTLVNCTFLDGASLYVVGWRSDPPDGERADVLISGLESRSGGGVVVANRFPPGSRVTVVDSVLIAEKRVAYRGDYDLGDASACLVVHKVNLTGSVLTIARTHVAAVFGDAVGLLFVGGVALHSRGALYLDGLAVQAALGLCVSVEGGVAASGGSVVAFVDSDFLLCKHALSVRGAVSVSGSAVALVRSDFFSTEDYAVAFYSTVSLDGGSMLLAKDNMHDGVSREMLYAAGAVTAAGSTLSFVRNRALLPRMLSVSLSLSAGAHLRVACNGAGGRVLSTAEEYAAAGFGDAGSIDFVGCDACDRDTHCYAPGTASASMKNGVCVCLCGSGGYGEACVPVGAPALPPAVGTAPSVFVRESVTVRSVFVVLDGVCPVLYVPWMARDGADRCAERVAAERSCAVRDGRWSVARCGSGGERRERAGGAVRVRFGGAERCACADRHVSHGVCADGDGLPAGCRDVDAACVSSRLAVLAVRTGAGAVGPAARAVRAGCVRRGPRDRGDWWTDGGGGRRCAGACRWRCRAGRGCVRWRICVVRECARGCVGRGCAARVGEPGVRCAWVGVRERCGGQRVRRRGERQRRCADRWRAAGAAGVGVVCVRVVAVGARQQHQRQASVAAVVPAQCGACAEHADAPRERRQRSRRDGWHCCSWGRRPTVRCGVPDAERAGAAADGLQICRHHREIPSCGVWRLRRRRALLCCFDEGDVGVVSLPLC
ncbi:hypothetical protein TCDM_11051 [Trypanosoma cruzi Dm28c]|uniref:Dispersed gene family protein 1 (DGF-1) n=1 Tax=Trypanosoma cruzi Dm28c TaxID=1416333 RepID=V5B5T2_TRYCR|nr:hypothetical protein TCDM_11051 [Trypanosoma cruzi Dm28c]